jgi:L-gulonate 5-dehydrogenase
VMGVHVPGGLAEVVSVPAERLHPTPGLPAEVAVLTEPVAIGLQAVHRAAVAADDRMVILGAGPIGLFAALAAQDRGARILVADRVPGRLGHAARLGVARTVDTGAEDLAAAVADFTAGDGAAAVVEATGAPALVRLAVDLVAHSGTVVVIGLSNEPVSIPMVEFTRKELNVIGSRNSTGLFAEAVDLVARHAAVLAPLVTQSFPLAETPHAIRYARAHPDEVVKVVIRVAS